MQGGCQAGMRVPAGKGSGGGLEQPPISLGETEAREEKGQCLPHSSFSLLPEAQQGAGH